MRDLNEDRGSQRLQHSRPYFEAALFSYKLFEANTSKPRCHDVMPRSASTLVDGHHVTTLIRTWELGLVGWVGSLARRETRLFLVSSLAGWLPQSLIISKRGGSKFRKRSPRAPKRSQRTKKELAPRHPCKLRDARQLGLVGKTWRAVCSCSFPFCSTRGCVVVVVDAATPRGPGGETSPSSTVGSRTTNESETTTR